MKQKIAIIILILSLCLAACTGLPVQTMSQTTEPLVLNPTATAEPSPEATATPVVTQPAKTATVATVVTETDYIIYLPVVMVTDGGETDTAVIYPVETEDPVALYPIEPTPTKPVTTTPGPTNPTQQPPGGHAHNWVPVYKTINHPAEYEYQCRPGEEIKIKTCEVTTWTINGRPDLGPWSIDTCIHSAAEQMAIYNAAIAAQNECSRAGTCPGGMTISSYEYDVWGPGPEVCENVLIKEAWTEQVLDYYRCSICGEEKYP